MGIGWSIHKNGAWRGQLDRVRRWHLRLIEAALQGSPDLEDFAYSIFQNCYYLREWAEKTSDVPTHDLGVLFSQSHELRLCRDLCNGTKHLTISRPRVDANCSIGREYDPGNPSRFRLFVIADDKYGLLELANTCMKRWEEFFDKQTT